MATVKKIAWFVTGVLFYMAAWAVAFGPMAESYTAWVLAICFGSLALLSVLMGIGNLVGE
jgi:hypothetical protein